MSGKRVFGLLALILGVAVSLMGVWVLFNAVRFTIVQPVVVVVGAGLALMGAMALRAAPATPYPVHSAPAQQSGATNAAGTVFAVLLVALWAWYYFGGGLETQANRTMRDIQNKVAADAVAQYGIASRNGSPIEICVQAGFVAAAYLQAQDEANYQQWKLAEKVDCKKAGIDK